MGQKATIKNLYKPEPLRRQLIKLKVIVRGVFFALLLAAVTMVEIVPDAAAAARLYGTTGAGGTTSTLVELNPLTGALINTIGSVGYAVNGLEYDATTGKLYGSTSVLSSYNGLIEINMLTGAGTAVGVSGWGLTGTTAVTNITVDSAGNMFGWWDPIEDDLVSINKSTGVATRVGESGISTATNGLSFNSSGTLYMVNNNGPYYTVDTLTGAGTYVGSIGTTAHHGDFDPSSGLYYGIDTTGTQGRNLVLANLSTATYSTLSTVEGLHTLAFAPVPEPSTMLLLGSGLAGLVGYGRRKFRK